MVGPANSDGSAFPASAVRVRIVPARWEMGFERACGWTTHALTLFLNIGLVLLIGYLGMRMRALIP